MAFTQPLFAKLLMTQRNYMETSYALIPHKSLKKYGKYWYKLFYAVNSNTAVTKPIFNFLNEAHTCARNHKMKAGKLQELLRNRQDVNKCTDRKCLTYMNACIV